jgi:hypothetical protein
MAQAPERPAVEPADEELTPELALVDPELAERARERLADFPPPTVVAEPPVEPAGEPAVLSRSVVERIPTAKRAPDVGRREPTPAPREPVEHDEPPPRRRRGRRDRAQLLGIALVGAIGVALLLPTLLLSGGTSTSSADAPSVGAPAPLETAPAETSSSEPGPDTSRTDEANAPEAPAAGGPRTFGWVPVKRARHYHVAFFRGEQKIYETWPRGPRLVLQPEWTFKGDRFRLSPGQYRWVVRPGFGNRRTGRYGPPVVDASLLVRR